ncbi:MAG: rhodanese-like domain-containing protein, partial [Candidatus Methanomethyliaceae archaeon]|nr:rhodanese-like domain-containing protein [Candidatus Methanomethyliaceae archaeon]
DWGYGETIYDGQEFSLDKLIIKAIHTPGHSPDSTCYVIKENHTPILIFTGDTLFVGDVGRTDFLGPEMTPIMGEKLYYSIFNKLLPLGDGVIILPAHGAGSVCGDKISEREFSTIGIEKATNPMLKLSKEEFIAKKVEEKLDYPPYFKRMEIYNLKGPPLIGSIRPIPILTSKEFHEKIESGAQVIDVRKPIEFINRHIPKSYNVPMNMLNLAGWVLSYDKPVLLVTDSASVLDFIVRNLIRIGYDEIEGCLTDGLEGWFKEGLPVARLGSIKAQELKSLISTNREISILDIRDEYAWKRGHISGSINVPIRKLEEEVNRLSKDKPIVVICEVGNTSSFVASVLLRKGFNQVYTCLGGMEAWIKSGYSVESTQ